MTRILGDDWLLPELDDLNRAWFTRGTVCVQSCNACNAAQHPPELVCVACGSSDLGFRDSSGAGKIESYARVRHPVHPALADKCPYTILVVSLDDIPGVNVVGNLLGAPDAELAVGQAVHASFETVQDPEYGTLQIPQWELA